MWVKDAADGEGNNRAVMSGGELEKVLHSEQLLSVWRLY